MHLLVVHTAVQFSISLANNTLVSMFHKLCLQWAAVPMPAQVVGCQHFDHMQAVLTVGCHAAGWTDIHTDR